ncbi:hypothetical protein [Methylobacterium gnaphalii]|uniref:Uncharacterized protein n=1 Tax=Methylobacterium gnaphalii TaxID=1010610 RepID=A0A512JGU9_9HYPH|nr:hypothetical protein [Methylobacterium gnaphalii]GEP09187.1 hypothetical protein MGN01_10320 [Methylobacterium gnaphalii]GJD67599.1 hypothetical protein MMMDOFMJ_0515 [Methylobacterium gnaphalii]GLS50510.1 hypothetical protein GCM10007885_33620 [Methylobacterium gnaphalii]
MSTISAASQAYPSPKQRILDSISSKASAGSISSTDQTALDGAVESIDSSLTSNGSVSPSSLSPSDLKSRIDGLISQQVDSGALTSDQADTLKQVLSQGHSGHGGHHGVHGAGGSPPALPAADGSDDSDDSDDPFAAVLNGSTATTGSTSDPAGDLLSSFMKQLQDSQNQTSAYGANGTNGNNNGSASAMLLDFQA